MTDESPKPNNIIEGKFPKRLLEDSASSTTGQPFSLEDTAARQENMGELHALRDHARLGSNKDVQRARRAAEARVQRVNDELATEAMRVREQSQVARENFSNAYTYISQKGRQLEQAIVRAESESSAVCIFQGVFLSGGVSILSQISNIHPVFKDFFEPRMLHAGTPLDTFNQNAYDQFVAALKEWTRVQYGEGVFVHDTTERQFSIPYMTDMQNALPRGLYLLHKSKLAR